MQVFLPQQDAVLVLIAHEGGELAEVWATEPDITTEVEGMTLVGVVADEERGEDVEVAP